MYLFILSRVCMRVWNRDPAKVAKPAKVHARWSSLQGMARAYGHIAPLARPAKVRESSAKVPLMPLAPPRLPAA